MSIGTAYLNIAVDRAKMMLTISGVVHHRNSVIITMTGFAPSVPGNLTLMVFKGVTQVCNPPVLTGSPTAGGTLITDTDKMMTAFAGVEDGEIREFDVRLWDSGAGEFLAVGVLKIIGTARTYTGDTGTVYIVPISDPVWLDGMGNMKLIDNVMHIFDPDDGGWYPLTRKGVGDQGHLDSGAADEKVVI